MDDETIFAAPSIKSPKIMDGTTWIMVERVGEEGRETEAITG